MLADRSEDYLRRFDAAMMECPDDPRAGFRSWLEQLSQRATKPDYRGCALTNAAVEYPERKHPARLVAAANKGSFGRAEDSGTAMGAQEPALLADGLLLLIEGAYASGQLFGPDGPAGIVVEAADMLIDTCCGK